MKIVISWLSSNKKYLVLILAAVVFLSWLVFIVIFKAPAHYEITGVFVLEPNYENAEEVVLVEMSMSRHRNIFSPDQYDFSMSVDGGSPKRGHASDINAFEHHENGIIITNPIWFNTWDRYYSSFPGTNPGKEYDGVEYQLLMDSELGGSNMAILEIKKFGEIIAVYTGICVQLRGKGQKEQNIGT